MHFGFKGLTRQKRMMYDEANISSTIQDIVLFFYWVDMTLCMRCLDLCCIMSWAKNTNFKSSNVGLEPMILKWKVWCSTDWANRSGGSYRYITRDMMELCGDVDIIMTLKTASLVDRSKFSSYRELKLTSIPLWPHIYCSNTDI